MGDGFELTPPEPARPVPPEKAIGLVPVDEEQKSKLKGRVVEFVDQFRPSAYSL